MSKLVDVKKDFEQVFLGSCKGVGIRRRGIDDHHAMFIILVEDDENWYESDGQASCFWMPELIVQLQMAEAWLFQNATKYQYGWLLKKNEEAIQSV